MAGRERKGQKGREESTWPKYSPLPHLLTSSTSLDSSLDLEFTMSSVHSSTSTAAPLSPPLDNKADLSPASLNETTPTLAVSNARRMVLLVIFCASQFVDIISVSGAFISVAQMTVDLDLTTSQAVWIVTSYSITFASFLLLVSLFSST